MCNNTVHVFGQRWGLRFDTFSCESPSVTLLVIGSKKHLGARSTVARTAPAVKRARQKRCNPYFRACCMCATVLCRLGAATLRMNVKDHMGPLHLKN